MNYLSYITEARISKFNKKTKPDALRGSDYVLGYHMRIEETAKAPQYNGGMEYPFKNKSKNWPMHVGTRQQAAARIFEASFDKTPNHSVVMYRVVGSHKFKDDIAEDKHDRRGHNPETDNEDAQIYNNAIEGSRFSSNEKDIQNISYYTTRPSKTIQYMIPVKVVPLHTPEMVKYIEQCKAFHEGNRDAVAVYFMRAFFGKDVDGRHILKMYNLLADHMNVDLLCDNIGDAHITKDTPNAYVWADIYGDDSIVQGDDEEENKPTDEDPEF